MKPVKVIRAFQENGPDYFLLYEGTKTFGADPICRCDSPETAETIARALNTQNHGRVKINCITNKGGAAQLSDSPAVWASYAVATAGDIPPAELFYSSIEMPDGHHVQLFVNRETGLVVLDYIHKKKPGGTELLRTTLNPVRSFAHLRRKKGQTCETE